MNSSSTFVKFRVDPARKLPQRTSLDTATPREPTALEAAGQAQHNIQFIGHWQIQHASTLNPYRTNVENRVSS